MNFFKKYISVSVIPCIDGSASPPIIFRCSSASIFATCSSSIPPPFPKRNRAFPLSRKIRSLLHQKDMMLDDAP